MLEDVTLRLLSLGYTVIEADSWMIQFIIGKVQQEIIVQAGVYDADLGVMVVPDGLYWYAVDKATGEFMGEKKSIGGLTGFDVSAAVKSIQEGDTSVTFAFGSGDLTPEKRLDLLISYLKGDESGTLASYRKLQW
jgi:hypothetical protein